MAETKNTLEFTDDNFQEQVLKNDKPVLVDFWAEWCGPCVAMAPVIDELADEYEGKFVVGKLNVDQHGNASTEYGVRSIPTLLIFKNGEVVDKQVGKVGKGALKSKMDAHL